MAGDIAAGAARPPALPLAVLLSTPLLIAAFALSPTFELPTAAALPLLAAGLGLQLAGAVLASAQLPVPRAGSALLRGVMGAGLLLLIALGIGLPLLQWPFAALRASGALGPVLLFCGGVAVAGLLASRVFTDPVLLFVPEPPTRRSLGQHLARARLHSQRLFNRSQVSLGQSSAGGLLVLLLLLPPLLALDAIDVGQAGPWTWALALHLLLIAPLAALGLARLVQTIAVEAAQASTPRFTEPGASSSALAETMVLPSELPAELAELAGLIQAAPIDALFAAARSGDSERALALLQGFEAAPAEPEPPPGRDQRGLAVLATLLSDLRLLRALILRGADLNQARAGLTPLLAATRDSYHGRPDAVAMLLANGADPRCVDADGRCPLHYAARSADPEVAAQLLDAGAEINALDRSGRSPLAEACAAGSWRLARFLLERGARCEPEGGQPALLAAAAGDDDPVGVELLLRHKAKVDASGRLGRSALMDACLAGNAAIVTALVKAGADVNRADQQGVTALMEAARAGAVGAIDVLRRKSPQVDAIDAHGRSALSIACGSAKADADTVTRLLQLGASVELRCASGQTALEQARSAQRWDLVARIDPDHPLPAAVDDSPHSAEVAGSAEDNTAATAETCARERLQRALRRGRADLLPALLRALQPSPSLLRELFDELAASQPRAALSRLAAALPASGEHSRESLLASAVERAAVAPEALEALLDLGTPVVGAGSLARYLRACLDARLPPGPDELRALRLLGAGADAFGRHEGDSPLLLALQLGWPRLIARLLELGADPNSATAAGLGALQIATEHADLVALRLLICAGARPDRRSPDGQTALGCALSLGDSALLRWLDWARWPHPGRALRDIDLIAASVAGDAVAAECLLELGLGRRARDARGCSALLRAAGAGHVEVVAVLLKAGLDPAVAADSGMTALTAAISQGHAQVVELLLAGGAHVEQSLPGALRPLMLAAALGKVDAVRLLLGAAAERNGVDADGNTVLHHAARYGFRASEPVRAMALWSALSPSAAELAQANGMGETPLLLLLGAAEAAGTPVQIDALMPQLERLLELGAALDSQDQRGFSALHWAAQHGLLPAVQRLLRAGADPQRRDSLARSPREVALTRGYIDIASELEGPRPAPSMARFLRSRVD
jgi:ankyrin repeat protein